MCFLQHFPVAAQGVQRAEGRADMGQLEREKSPFPLFFGFPITITNWDWRELQNSSVHQTRATCASTHWLLPGTAHREGFHRSVNPKAHSDSKNKQRRVQGESHCSTAVLHQEQQHVCKAAQVTAMLSLEKEQC